MPDAYVYSNLSVALRALLVATARRAAVSYTLAFAEMTDCNRKLQRCIKLYTTSCKELVLQLYGTRSIAAK